MLGEIAVNNYIEGYNCSRCILKACEHGLNLPLPKQCLDSCSCLSNGFGFGGFCSSIVASFMVFGLKFDDEVAKRLRIQFLEEFQDKYGSFNCSAIKIGVDDKIMCEEIIYFVGELVEKLIYNEE